MQKLMQKLMNRNSLSLKARLVAVFAALIFSSLSHAQLLQFPKGEFPLTDYQKSSIDIEEILSGGPPRDGIPSIDKPEFVSIKQASDWLDAREPVISVQVNGQAKAYPLQILMYHEIVNDSIAGEPISVTFCPLCNASIVFERTLIEKDASGSNIPTVLDFGTTGKLRKSDLVMYDRQSETWWQQFTGVGIIGKYTDVMLTRIASQIISFDEFSKAFPDASVLSQQTGFSRPYGNNPYTGYDSIDSNPFLYKGELDPRLPPMERVLSLGEKGDTQLVPLSTLNTTPVLNLEFNGSPTVVIAASTAASALDQGTIKTSRAVPSAAAFNSELDTQVLTFTLENGNVIDDQTGSVWNAFGLSTSGELEGTQLRQIDQGVHFAFAWLAFDPGARIVKADNASSAGKSQ